MFLIAHSERTLVDGQNGSKTRSVWQFVLRGVFGTAVVSGRSSGAISALGAFSSEFLPHHPELIQTTPSLVLPLPTPQH